MPEGPQREVTGSSTSSKAAVPDPLIGRVINGRFKIVSVIARGGMGKVYRAEQAPLGRICALKVLSPKYEGDRDPEFHKRFFLEAATAAKLSHPNTVTVFDYGQSDDDIYYIAMEYIEGKTLHRVLREEGPFSETRTAHVARQICRSLREAHALGVVHRDLKPGNVLLVDREDEHDHVKVLDFGLVKDVESDQNLTQQGLFMGSPKYMAPEQITGGVVSARTDIYALGVMMYEMLSGRVPFDKGASVGTLMSHVHDPVPPMAAHHPTIDISPAMEAIIYRCLEKDPAQRFSSMNELLAALKRTDSGSAMRDTSESLPAIAGPSRTRTSSPALTITGDYSGVSAPNSAPPTSAVTYSGPISTDASIKPSPAAPVFVAPPITDSMGPRPTPPDEPIAPSDVGRSPARRAVAWGVAAVLASFVGVTGVMMSRSHPDPASPPPVATTEPTAKPPGAPDPTSAPTLSTHTVKVESSPSGASVYEGNKELCAETPCEIVWRGQEASPTSEHELVLEKKGYKATVRVSGAEERVRAKLDATPTSSGGNSPKIKSNVYKPDPYKGNPY